MLLANHFHLIVIVTGDVYWYIMVYQASFTSEDIEYIHSVQM